MPKKINNLNSPVTKRDLKKTESGLREDLMRVETRLDAKIDSNVTRLENKIDTFKDEIITGQDKMMVILKRLDQERILLLSGLKN